MSTTLPLCPDPHRAFRVHRGLPAHHAAPLPKMSLDGHPVWIKEETGRIGFGAFKAMAELFAVARPFGQPLGRDGGCGAVGGRARLVPPPTPSA